MFALNKGVFIVLLKFLLGAVLVKICLASITFIPRVADLYRFSRKQQANSRSNQFLHSVCTSFVNICLNRSMETFSTTNSPDYSQHSGHSEHSEHSKELDGDESAVDEEALELNGEAPMGPGKKGSARARCVSEGVTVESKAGGRSAQQSAGRRKRRAKPPPGTLRICLVCGDQAIGYSFTSFRSFIHPSFLLTFHLLFRFFDFSIFLGTLARRLTRCPVFYMDI